MSSQSSGNPSSSSYPQRRGSITEYFRPPQPSVYPGPITSAAAQANHRRRMSFSGTGLTGTSPPAPWFGYGNGNGGTGGRRASVSSVSSSVSSPVDVDADDTASSPTGSVSGSFARRLSFGARALRDVKRSMSFGTVGEEPENEHMATQEQVAPPPPPAHSAAPKHDEVQERILKGDFYF